MSELDYNTDGISKEDRYSYREQSGLRMRCDFELIYQPRGKACRPGAQKVLL